MGQLSARNTSFQVMMQPLLEQLTQGPTPGNRGLDARPRGDTVCRPRAAGVESWAKLQLGTIVCDIGRLRLSFD